MLIAVVTILNGLAIIRNVATYVLINKALKHSEVSREKLEYRNELNDK